MIKSKLSAFALACAITTTGLSAGTDYNMLADGVDYLIDQVGSVEKRVSKIESQQKNDSNTSKKLSSDVTNLLAQIAILKKKKCDCKNINDKLKVQSQKIEEQNKTITELGKQLNDAIVMFKKERIVAIDTSVSETGSFSKQKMILDEQKKKLQQYLDSRKYSAQSTSVK